MIYMPIGFLAPVIILIKLLAMVGASWLMTRKLKEKGNENIMEQLAAGVKPFDRKRGSRKN